MNEAILNLGRYFEMAREAVTEKPFLYLVLVPTTLFFIYLSVFREYRYESVAVITVKSAETSAVADASSAILTGFAGGSVNGDAKLVEQYIHSMDLLNKLDEKIGLREHYSQDGVEFFSRLSKNEYRENYLELYRSRVIIEIEPSSSIITVKAQAFDAEYANQLLNIILVETENYINDISRNMAKRRLDFIRGETEFSEEALQAAQSELVEFQAKHGLLDPSAEGATANTITGTIESLISQKEAQLQGMREFMSEQAPQMVLLRNEIAGLKQQLVKQRSLISSGSGEEISLAEILVQYSALKTKVELSSQAYSSALISQELARVDAYKQLKFLSTVQSPTLPENNQYPLIIYNVVLMLFVLAALYLVGSISGSLFRELSSDA